MSLPSKSAEHERIECDGGDVVKHLRRHADMGDWRRRQDVAAAHPDLFVPFAIEGRTIRQPFIDGPPGTNDDAMRIYAALHARGVVGVDDIVPHNIVGGRAVDFQFTPPADVERRVIVRDNRRVEIYAPRRVHQS